MSTDRLTRVNELLRREIGEALYHVLHDYEVDMAAITITTVDTSSNLRDARVGISIREHLADRNKMMHHIKHSRGEIQKLINSHLNLKYTPRLAFFLDTSVEKGDRVLAVLQKMRQDGAVDDDHGLPPEETEDAS
jgi:ribosome-binding factor A